MNLWFTCCFLKLKSMAGKLRSERITTEGILSRKLTLENHILDQA